jgi:hypothetical protein
MKVRLHEDASQRYRTSIVSSGGQARGMTQYEREFMAKLEALNGQTVEVETDFLFSDQFNTPPIPGVSENGLRLMARDVAEVIDDARPGQARCNWCGKTTAADAACFNCGKTEYLAPFRRSLLNGVILAS